MKKKCNLFFILTLFTTALSGAQDTLVYKLRLSAPVVEFPQNTLLPNHFPTMNQALEWSNDLYELSFWGIDELGDKLFLSKTKPYAGWRKFSNNAFKYALSLAFSNYGSELPIPLGIWAHEEFHRAVLGVQAISSENGNWLFSRWDGTVYGISDLSLANLKSTDVNQLLYSYVAGVQYELMLNEKNTLGDFYKQRSMPKSALLLYDAYYVFNYFRFSTSSLSDSVKIIAPVHESADPVKRDFAGADLTAWAYDMFNPELPYTSRDSFPNGEGVNRRIGFADLSVEARDYLIKQKQLSLLNFLNPAIFFISRIKINNDLSFNFFAQYSPTHFGNDIAFYFPVKYKKYDLLLNVHSYNNRSGNAFGIGLGLYNYRFSKKIESDFTLLIWDQPKSSFDNENIAGGSFGIKTNYVLSDNFSGFISLNGKSQGWILGNPFLSKNISFQLGLSYNLFDKLN